MLLSLLLLLLYTPRPQSPSTASLIRYFAFYNAKYLILATFEALISFQLHLELLLQLRNTCVLPSRKMTPMAIVYFTSSPSVV